MVLSVLQYFILKFLLVNWFFILRLHAVLKILPHIYDLFACGCADGSSMKESIDFVDSYSSMVSVNSTSQKCLWTMQKY